MKHWYWGVQDYGPWRYVRVRWWHLALIGAAFTYVGLAVYVTLRAGE